MDRSGGIWLMPTKDWIPDILLLLNCILDERVGSYDGNGEGVVDPSDAIESTHLCSIGIAIFRTPDRFGWYMSGTWCPKESNQKIKTRSLTDPRQTRFYYWHRSIGAFPWLFQYPRNHPERRANHRTKNGIQQNIFAAEVYKTLLIIWILLVIWFEQEIY